VCNLGGANLLHFDNRGNLRAANQTAQCGTTLSRNRLSSVTGVIHRRSSSNFDCAAHLSAGDHLAGLCDRPNRHANLFCLALVGPQAWDSCEGSSGGLTVSALAFRVTPPQSWNVWKVKQLVRCSEFAVPTLAETCASLRSSRTALRNQFTQ